MFFYPAIENFFFPAFEMFFYPAFEMFFYPAIEMSESWSAIAATFAIITICKLSEYWI